MLKLLIHFFFVQNSKSKLPVIGVASFRSKKDQSSPSDLGEEGTDAEDYLNSDLGPTLSTHDQSSRQSGTCSISSDAKGTSQDVLENHEKSERDEIPGNLEKEASEGRRNTLATKLVGKEYSVQVAQSSHSFSQKGEVGLRKVSFVLLRHSCPSTFLDDMVNHE